MAVTPIFGIGEDLISQSQSGELIFLFQKQKEPGRLKSEANQVAAYLSEKLKRPVLAKVPSDYASSVQALISKKADIAYVDSLAYILANRDGGAKMLLAERRIDSKGVSRTDYDAVLVVRKDSPLKSAQDILSKTHKIKFAFTSPTSTSGYVMPYRYFVEQGVLQPKQNPKDIFEKLSFGNSYVGALQEVILGRADVAAVSYYTMEGPSADKYLSRAEREQLRILHRLPGVPTHIVAARSGLSDYERTAISNALLSLSKDRPELLFDVYGAKELTTADADQHLSVSRQALSYLGIGPEAIVK